ncbi:hypothetical protein PHLCEN_2v2559 [Hermanssonia centrifuga]|uniref:Uncharacterized protein n=1 Tax=Hermanssonia centrifuga TaxID=98765 RepID=A0A2R6RLK0_9APHY|nr:hypothetical protein PHLCEN_2v2559 [Hermanssonia centrifuga]
MPNQWLDWWCAIQPSPRRTEPVSFEINLDHPKNLAPQCWAPISKSGPQGISNMVYALGLSYPSAKRQAMILGPCPSVSGMGFHTIAATTDKQ